MKITTLSTATDYPAYRQMVIELFAQDHATGDNHSEAMLYYTKLNLARMRRLDKTTKLLPATEVTIQEITRPLRWLSLTEGWCGDAAQILPILDKIAAANPNISHEVILRDQHLELMDQFLTNGARAIPLTIIIDATTDEVLGHWGPRPSAAQDMVMNAKAAASTAEGEARKNIMDTAKLEAQKWYARDKGRAVQEEFMAALMMALG